MDEATTILGPRWRQTAHKNPPFELRQFNSLPLKIGLLGPKRKGSSSYHHELQGAFAVKNFREVTMGTSEVHSHPSSPPQAEPPRNKGLMKRIPTNQPTPTNQPRGRFLEKPGYIFNTGLVVTGHLS